MGDHERDYREDLLSAAQRLNDPGPTGSGAIQFRPVPDTFASPTAYYTLLSHNIKQQYLSATTTTQQYYEEFLPRIEVCGAKQVEGYTRAQYKKLKSGGKPKPKPKQFYEVRLAQTFQQKSSTSTLSGGAGAEVVGSKQPKTAADQRAAAAEAGAEESSIDTLLKLRDSVLVCRIPGPPGGKRTFVHVVSSEKELLDAYGRVISPSCGDRAFLALMTPPGAGRTIPAGQQLAVIAFVGGLLAQYTSAQKRLAACDERMCDEDDDFMTTDLERSVLQPQECYPASVPIETIHYSDLVPINDSQRHAVLSIRNRLTLVQGPPGTGKSTTIFHIANSWLNQVSLRAGQRCAILVTCVTNVAVDSVMEKLGQLEGLGGVRCLVLGNAKKVGPAAAPFTLGAKVDRDEDVVRLLGAASRSSGTAATDEDIKSARFAAERRIICEQTTVFLCTVASNYRLTELRERFGKDFPRLIAAVLDEAGATAEDNIPLLLDAGAENLVLLGDQKQLGPLVVSHEPPTVLEEKKANRSFLQRCCDAGRVPVLLSEQYRMPRFLGSLVSGLCYEGQLTTFSKKKELFEIDQQLRWLDCREQERSVKNSYVNFQQAAVVVQLLTMATTTVDVQLQKENGRSAAGRGGNGSMGDNIKPSWNKLNNATPTPNAAKSTTPPPLHDDAAETMVICMYRPQTKLLHAALQTLAPQVLRRPCFRIVTVDAAQGSEADHVILVTCRSNGAGKIGFVANRNRLNVAISRAKQTLTIIGDAECMGRGDSDGWGTVAEACGRGGLSGGGPGSSHIRGKGFAAGGSGGAPSGGSMIEVASPSAVVEGSTSTTDGPRFLLTTNIRERIAEIAADVVPQAQIFGEKSAAPATANVCSFFLKGRCTRGTACPFRHPQSSQGSVASAGSGSAGNGSGPPTQHTVAASASTPICTFFQRGLCTRGGACPYRHESKVIKGGGGKFSTKGRGKR